ncbi:SusC/RagA family TonB-linked outer membrane protein [Pedobacter nyackensis]|uniref:TonB-linked outer membrane protein, SusC/RagA family n=1 Tax=Pedobacter nyackensis TaxID=475255 RepID=A0A1W2DBG7_9SPHI|nr:SusC/RagA family TonB-linked outer membrane protein [Pedobacter nyackensis]SMC94805.1 TonB-linked outer membrane protein, SusC/RagA family [Pedobacter nyackensis]
MKFYALFKRRHLARVAQPILRIMNSVLDLIRNTDKRKLIMRINLTVILLTASLLQVSAGGFAQKINLTKNNISLTEVFKEIRKQSGYDFVYATPQIKLARKVDVFARNASLADVLERCFLNQPFTYEIQNKTIVIRERNDGVIAPDRKIQGTVVDRKDGKPLPGVTVIIKGTKIGTQTDVKGNFALNVPNGTETLVIRFVGYKTQEVALANFKSFTIRLEEDLTSLDNVVVTGVFDRPVENFTGAAKTIDGQELKRVNSNSIFAAIAALDPALRLVPNNVMGGNINQLPEIQLRGANSLPNLTGEFADNPNAPLFILDGFQVGAQRIFDLDMNMIKSITILKDASATSIYGSRGANGVLVITTVLPKSGKLQVTVNNDFRLTTPDLSVYNLLNAAEKLDFEKRVGFYTAGQSNQQYTLDEIYNSRARAVANGVNTDWLSFPTQTGTSNRTSLYVQGGDQFIRYGLQMTGDFQKGVMKGQNRNNYSGQFDLSYEVKNLRFRNSVRLFQNTANESSYGAFSQYARMNPYWKPFDENGNPVKVMETNAFGTFTNPLYDAQLNTINKSQYFGISNNLQIRWNILPSLFLESAFSLNKQTGSSDKFFPAQHSMFVNEKDLKRKGSYDVGNNNSLGFENLTTANFNKSMGKHLIYSTLGVNIASTSSNFYNVSTVGFPFDQLDNLLFASQYKPDSRPTGDESTVRRLGLLLNANYAFDNRYLADISVRRDGSSQFGSNKRYGTFWSTGLGWNIHNEAFFKGNQQVSRLKARASYGSSGSLNIPAYRAQTRYTFGVDNVYDGDLGAAIMGLGNTELGWQDVRTLNLGLDITLFHDRLDMRFDHYRSTTNNTITNVSLAPSNGFSDYAENLGKIQNTGYEFYGRYKIIDNKQKAIVWSVNVAAVTNKNVLKELSNKLKASNTKLNAASNQKAPNIILEEGQSINTLFVVRSLGIDPISGTEVFLKKDGTTTFTWAAADKVAVGITDPKWNGAFGSNLNYRGLEVGVIFSYRFGGQIYNQTLVDKVQGADTKYNVDRRAYDLGWTKPGDESMFTRFGTNPVLTRLSSRFVQDDNTMSLNSASVGYNFYKHAFVKRMGLSSFSLTASTNDLFTLSSVELERGTNNPFSRTFSLSIRAGF